MQTFYKIENDNIQIGSGDLIPDGFIEYVVGQEPLELVEALKLEKEKQIVQDKLNECIAFLNKTEFKFNGDYDLKDTPEWLELKAKRQEYREFIRANNG